MRIDGTSRTSSTGKKGQARRSSAGGQAFVLGDEAEVSKTAGGSTTGPVTGIDAILALQGVEDPLFAKRKTVKRGRDLLDVLEGMKADLLAGQVSEGKLLRLVALIGEARTRSDPALDAIVDDIELRARVELAKFGRFPASIR